MFALLCLATVVQFVSADFHYRGCRDKLCREVMNHPNRHLLPTGDECGIQHYPKCYSNMLNSGDISFRIRGGKPVTPAEFPWMARIYLRGDLWCGGVVINKRHILTAAHCLAGKPENNKPAYVVLGLLVNKNNHQCGPTIQKIEIKDWIVHKGFRMPEDFVTPNDIALIILKKNIKFTDFVSPICLPLFPKLLKNKFKGKLMDVAGWSDNGEVGGETFLRTVEIPVQDCGNGYDKTMMCAGGRYREGTCGGDSGGPLMYSDGYKYYAVGVLSGGANCTSEKYDYNTSVFSKVSEFMPWIMNHLN